MLEISVKLSELIWFYSNWNIKKPYAFWFFQGKWNRIYLFKVRALTFQESFFYLLYENPLKLTKNTFYFIWKSLFVFKIHKFFSWFCGHLRNGLTRKVSIISKFMTTQPGEQTITLHILILPNISRSKRSQTMKFGQLMDHIVRNIFLQKSFRKGGRETSSKTLFVS